MNSNNAPAIRINFVLLNLKTLGTIGFKNGLDYKSASTRVFSSYFINLYPCGITSMSVAKTDVCHRRFGILLFTMIENWPKNGYIYWHFYWQTSPHVAHVSYTKIIAFGHYIVFPVPLITLLFYWQTSQHIAHRHY